VIINGNTVLTRKYAHLLPPEMESLKVNIDNIDVKEVRLTLEV